MLHGQRKLPNERGKGGVCTQYQVGTKLDSFLQISGRWSRLARRASDPCEVLVGSGTGGGLGASVGSVRLADAKPHSGFALEQEH